MEISKIAGSNKYKFQGQEKQPETGYSHFKWRMHDPTIGRFISVDPLSEKYYHNSVYAFSENKVTSHIELEGLEAVALAEYMKNANSGSRYKVEQPIDPSIGTGTKAGASGNLSFGGQFGMVDKLLGMGLGIYVNFGSVDMATLQFDMADGNKGELFGENNQVTIKQGGELSLGVVGFETSKDRVFTNFFNILKITESSGYSIGPVKFSENAIGTFSMNKENEYVNIGERKFTSTTIAEIKSKGAYGFKAEGKAELTLGGDLKTIDNRPWESRQDATRVIKNN